MSKNPYNIHRTVGGSSGGEVKFICTNEFLAEIITLKKLTWIYESRQEFFLREAHRLGSVNKLISMLITFDYIDKSF